MVCVQVWDGPEDEAAMSLVLNSREASGDKVIPVIILMLDHRNPESLRQLCTQVSEND